MNRSLKRSVSLLRLLIRVSSKRKTYLSSILTKYMMVWNRIKGRCLRWFLWDVRITPPMVSLIFVCAMEWTPTWTMNKTKKNFFSIGFCFRIEGLLIEIQKPWIGYIFGEKSLKIFTANVTIHRNPMILWWFQSNLKWQKIQDQQ